MDDDLGYEILADLTFVNSLTGLPPSKIDAEFTRVGITRVLDEHKLPTIAPDGSIDSNVFEGITSGHILGGPEIRTFVGRAYDDSVGRQHTKRRHQQLLKQAPDGLVTQFCKTIIPWSRVDDLVEFAEHCTDRTRRGNAAKAKNLPQTFLLRGNKKTKS